MKAVFGVGEIASCARGCRKALTIVLLCLAPLVVAGCLQMERIVRVNGDGSGVLVERLVLGNEMVEMLREMSAATQPEGEPFSIRDDEELRGKAANFGEGVRFLSAKDLETDFGKGFEARYAFADINKLRVGQDPGESMPGGESAAANDNESKFITFTFHPANPAELVIHWPVDEAASEAEASSTEASDEATSPEQEQMAMEMMKSAFKDMRMAIHIEVAGDILDTNATHRRGNRVTLMEFDFGEILSSEEALRSMAGNKPGSVADMKELMKLIPGLKMEIEPEVTIRFQ
jgi:hypothetical protein